MKTQGKTTGKDWLLIKERDGWARAEAPDAAYPQESVLSGLTVEELRDGREPRATRSARELERPRRAAADASTPPTSS